MGCVVVDLIASGSSWSVMLGVEGGVILVVCVLLDVGFDSLSIEPLLAVLAGLVGSGGAVGFDF